MKTRFVGNQRCNMKTEQLVRDSSHTLFKPFVIKIARNATRWRSSSPRAWASSSRVHAKVSSVLETVLEPLHEIGIETERVYCITTWLWTNSRRPIQLKCKMRVFRMRGFKMRDTWIKHTWLENGESLFFIQGLKGGAAKSIKKMERPCRGSRPCRCSNHQKS